MKIFFLSLAVAFSAQAKNLHLIDEGPNGFKLYRYGQPSQEEFKEMIDLGIKDVMVLSGDGYKKGNEMSHGLEIVYNQKQDDDVPLTKEFLNFFDAWVKDAKRTGKKIAFRCECGCHRTGRLAAYYQMKYMGLTSDDAIAIMDEYGSLMFLHRQLYPQVRALNDLINGRPCGEDPKHCPIPK